MDDQTLKAAHRISRRAAIAPFLAMEAAREAGALVAAGKSIMRFDVGQPHLGAPEIALKAAEAALRREPLGYTDALGSHALREAIAAHYRTTYGVSVDPRRVVVTTGASGAFLLAFLALFDTGDAVALAAPGYPPYRHILSALGMKPLILEARAKDKLQLTGNLLRRAASEHRIAGALVASPANPTGAMLDKPALEDLCASAKAREIAIVSDEIYHGLTYEGPAISALNVDPDAMVINSFSKYWAMTGWRVGWLIAPEHLVKPVERLAQNLFICAPAVAQAAALGALQAGEECEARRVAYAENRALLLQALPEIGIPPIVEPAGAFYMLIDVSRFGMDSAAFCHRALVEAGVALTPGLDFDETHGRDWVRLAYPIAKSDVAEGLERLRRFLTAA